jgi:hypothetical protein
MYLKVRNMILIYCVMDFQGPKTCNQFKLFETLKK